jgi:hypothetical protein
MLAVLIALVLPTTAQTIVQKHGRLRVQGNRIVDKNNVSVSLAGNSMFWSNATDVINMYETRVVNHLVANWKSNIIRAAMGVKETWDNGTGYIDNPTLQMAKIRTVIDAAIANGVYVIVDWHSHEAEKYQSQSIAFFKEIARLYGNTDNLIYEVYNEPIRQSWSTVKSYSTNVISAIRAIDPDNLVIVGSPTWSQDVDIASANPISDANTAYTLHFYAGTHSEGLRDKARTALSNGVAIFATEWGTVNADGNGGVNRAETEKWMQFFRDNKISHANWAVSDKAEGSAIVQSGRGIDGLLNNQLTESGIYVKSIIENWSVGGGGTNQAPAVSIVSPSNGANFTTGSSITVRANASDADGSVTKVEFFNNGSKLGEDASSPYEYTISNAVRGNYNLTAKATDNIGASTTSSAIVVIVNDKVNNVPPTVAITSPASGANFITGASIAIRATASDADGSVSKVEFFNNGSKLGEDASVPYEYTISGAAKGTYNLTAKATDNGGASATSSSVAINVNDGTPPPPGSCSFGTPIANPLPSFNRADFSRVYVLGSNGPDVTNIRRFRINWNASVKGLYQFAVNTKNGTPAFYIDLRNSLTHSFNAARPDVKISGSGLPGFDGDYWVTKNGDNFVMVSKTRGFTLYFTNASTAPACSNSSRIGSEADNGLVLKATPLPVLGNTMNLTWAGAEGVLQLEIADFSGRTLIQKTINSNANTATLDVSSLAAGTYIATLKGKDTFSKLVFTRQ